ncbi:MAG: sialic acid TRAP transporter substrate-binding protein SiaP [Geminicoccaceae bacterium]|jgi:tripartite ATP-independent transporter DctP family solute receptor|nr:sialic acid TRAP transporter substrate-binding protein SiaP [Geminicoccaceae bacterium]HRY24962.1 sialic acid TRAP transporter substrate-binding protein SiaP [Geminicoccaceae bacterium]
MISMSRRALGASVAAAMALLAGGASAQQALKFAHVYETSEAYHTAALWAAEQIAERTDGRYTMEVFPASSLGKETDINQGLTLGTVDIIYTGMNFAGRSFEPLTIASAPYMFRDVDHWKAYAESDLWDEMKEGYVDATGHHVSAILYYGERHVTSKTPINTPEDMKGLKIRVPDAPLYVLFPNAVGANPTPIAFAEVYLALQQGTVDAQENPLPTILAKKFYEPTPIINLTGHITESLITIISGNLWNSLSDEDKVIFDEVFQEAAIRSNEEIYASEAELVTGFAELGATVNEVDRSLFKAVVEPHLVGDDVPWSQEQFDRLQAIK